jgi:hypothetical protein
VLPDAQRRIVDSGTLMRSASSRLGRWAGCWTGDFAGLEAELPRVIDGCRGVDRARAEYGAMLMYFLALRDAMKA